jgi:hypothetical protein
MFNDFDRKFNRTERVIKFGWVLTAVLVIGFIVGSILLAVHIVSVVKDEGLKPTVERIWHGPEK